MAFSQARQFGGGVSRAPIAAVEPSRGAAGAPGGASLGGRPQGGSAANDIAGALGLGGGMLGKFLYDKYKGDPSAVQQALAELSAGNVGTEPLGLQKEDLINYGIMAPEAAGAPFPAAQPAPAVQPSNFGPGIPAGLTGENLATYNSMLDAGISPTMITDWMTANGIMPMA